MFCEPLLPFLEPYFLCDTQPLSKLVLMERMKQYLITLRPDVLAQVTLTWLEAKIVYSLLFLFKNVELQAVCIDILSLVFQQHVSWGLQKQEAIAFIQAYFHQRHIQAPQSSTARELRNLALDTSQKFEKLVKGAPQKSIDYDLRNLGTQFLNSDYESVPQAPSMINKRKQHERGGTGSFFGRQEPPQAELQEVEIHVRFNHNEKAQLFKREQQSFSVDSSHSKFKKKFNNPIQIDTDAINSLYSYGGEKGRKNEM